MLETERIRQLELQKQQQEADMLKNGGWACGACRTVNSNKAHTCSVCTMAKPLPTHYDPYYYNHGKEHRGGSGGGHYTAHGGVVSSGKVEHTRAAHTPAVVSKAPIEIAKDVATLDLLRMNGKYILSSAYFK